ncbi:unnamed protein product, partial [Polarella glacialis]
NSNSSNTAGGLAEQSCCCALCNSAAPARVQRQSVVALSQCSASQFRLNRARCCCKFSLVRLGSAPMCVTHVLKYAVVVVVVVVVVVDVNVVIVDVVIVDVYVVLVRVV